MSVIEAPPSTARPVAAEQPADTVRLAQLEAQVQDLDRRLEEKVDEVEAEHHDVLGGRQVRWPWGRHRWAA